MRTKILVREEEILLVDKIIYLAVEFARLREADFYVVTQASGMPSGRQVKPLKSIFERVDDEYSPSPNTHFRTLQNPFRLS